MLNQHRGLIIAANQKDLSNSDGLDETLIDRLKVDDKKIDGMIKAVQQVIEAEDPEDKLLYSYRHPNGMLVENRTAPFGNILIIYESRPDVTIEAAISAYKAGNHILLKGGKEARNTNLCLVELWHEALVAHGDSKEKVKYLDVNRDEMQQMIRDNSVQADLIIPRGGDKLIEFVRSNSQAPVLVSGRGNNFIYIHDDADHDMALDLILNGKKRLSVCNAIDKVIINAHLINRIGFINNLIERLEESGIKIFSNTISGIESNKIKIDDGEDILYEEFLAPKIFLTQVNNVEEAIQVINKYSGGHSAVIVSSDNDAAKLFQKRVDCAAVAHNASSRFTDGGQFGFGAEIAISTQKLHFRGPLGLGQLITNKFYVYGTGQIRD